jgi:hypothetical protein
MFSIMQCGGYWDLAPRGFVEVQVERQIRDGINPDHARRFAQAMAFGGCSESEVWEIIKDRDCARFGIHHEIVSTDDLPDHWFRDAWARGHNGGPVFVDMVKAREVQWRKILHSVSEENKARRLSLNSRPLVRISKTEYQKYISRAVDEDELKRVWPESVPVVT